VVATYANQWHARGSPRQLAEADTVVREHCARIGRDPSTIERLTSAWAVVRDDAELAARVLERSLVAHGIPSDQAARNLPLLGSEQAVAAGLSEYVRIGFRHLVLSFRAPWDQATMERMPAVKRLLASMCGVEPPPPG
jgi:alkanesulfonate monooxygenase SsuD/methylene tetrahydromethanopterin reductase-like flavin-dependent oxidoreductase (luciferase family)